MTDLLNIAKQVISVAYETSKQILPIYYGKKLNIEKKSDQSPVTNADYLAHELITKGLIKINSDPIISEEGIELEYSERKAWDRFWLVDPIDGTADFIAKTDNFSINIAWLVDNRPVIGVVLLPVSGICYWGIIDRANQTQSAYWQASETSDPIPIFAQEKTTDLWRITVSRHHRPKQALDRFLERLKNYQLIPCGSTLKLCLTAKGEVDLYPMLGRNFEWDSAAGDCILEAAGGKIVDLSGKLLKYNKQNLENPFFVAFGKVSIETEHQIRKMLRESIENLDHG